MAIIPTTKEYATVYILPKIVNSKSFQTLVKDGDETMSLLMKYMKKELMERFNIDKHEAN